VVIAGYFVVASIGEQLVFFGEQLTDEQRRRADLLMTMAPLVLFVGTPIAVFIARACVRNVEEQRPEDAGTCACLIALCGPAAFFVASAFIGLVPSGAQSFVFGIIWLAGSALIFPVAVMVGMQAAGRRPHRYPAEVHPPR
jgi:MFS family permease